MDVSRTDKMLQSCWDLLTESETNDDDEEGKLRSCNESRG